MVNTIKELIVNGQSRHGVPVSWEGMRGPEQRVQGPNGSYRVTGRDGGDFCGFLEVPSWE